MDVLVVHFLTLKSFMFNGSQPVLIRSFWSKNPCHFIKNEIYRITSSINSDLTSVKKFFNQLSRLYEEFITEVLYFH